MANQDPKVSVVIPVYNVHKYIDACLESVVQQSYQNIEIILVNDGSTDDSGKKCDAWAKKDKRVKVVHKNNEGLNYARKSGWEVASGSCITFLDSDDLFHPKNIENSVAVMKKEDVDMVVYQKMDFSDKDSASNLYVTYHDTTNYELKKTTAEAFRFLVCNEDEKIYPMTAWGKLYKIKLLDKVDWRESNFRAYEDDFFTPQVFDKVKSFAILKQCLYFYRRNETGAVLSKKLVGNTLNGKSIGYLEYMNLLKAYWGKFFVKHKVSRENELNDFWFSNMIYRLNNLVESGLLDKENNVEYVGEIIKEMQKRHKNDIEQRDLIITSQATIINNFDSHLSGLKEQLARLRTPKGAFRNLAGSIKRYILKR